MVVVAGKGINQRMCVNQCENYCRFLGGGVEIGISQAMCKQEMWKREGVRIKWSYHYHAQIHPTQPKPFNKKPSSVVRPRAVDHLPPLTTFISPQALSPLAPIQSIPFPRPLLLFLLLMCSTPLSCHHHRPEKDR